MASAKLTSDIKAANKQLADCLKAGDTDGMAACYTTDGKVFAPGAKAVKGRRAIAKFWGEALKAAGIKSATLRTTELEQHGKNTAVEVGAVTLKGAGNKVLDKGTYVVVWKCVRGKWKLHRDIFNSDG